MSHSQKQKIKSKVIFKSFDKTNSTEKLEDRCRKSYKKSLERYNNFFLKYLDEIEALQPNGFACLQVMRYFVIGVLPQYCVLPDPLTKKERERVERILSR